MTSTFPNIGSGPEGQGKGAKSSDLKGPYKRSGTASPVKGSRHRLRPNPRRARPRQQSSAVWPGKARPAMMDRDSDSPIYALKVRKAVPSLALQPGDVVLLEDVAVPIGVYRPLEANRAIIDSILLALDRGSLTVALPQCYQVRLLLAALYNRCRPLLRLVTDADVAAALAESNPPREPGLRKRGDK